MNQKILIIAALVLVAVGGAYLLVTQTPSSAPAFQSGETAEGGAVAEQAEKVRLIEVSGDEFSFSPSEILLERGERVRIKFQNTGKAPHNFVLEGMSVATSVIQGGESQIVEFVAPETQGSYPITYFCSVPGHRESGMEGMIVVE